jgi:hypothetical protein
MDHGAGGESCPLCGMQTTAQSALTGMLRVRDNALMHHAGT